MRLSLPDLSLVLLIGPSGCGKSTFAAQHFLPTEVISSDYCRALVSDNEIDQTATGDAFAVLHFIAGKRLTRGRLTVVDATNVQERARKPLIELARRHYVWPVAIVFDIPESICQERNRLRTDRDLGPHVIYNQRTDMKRSLRKLEMEGIKEVHILRSPEEVASVVVERRPLWPDRRKEHGPFDLIGDIHGCCDELEELLTLLGYAPVEGVWRHPGDRRAIFLGDLVDRGPRVPDVLRIVMGMVEAGTALCVPGNHDDKLKRVLQGKKAQIRHGLEQSLEQLERETPEFRSQVAKFLDGLISHFVLDGGRLVAAHAGMREEMQGRASGHVRSFALYGDTTGEMDELGLPVRADWAADYRGSALVVYGHTPVYAPEWVNRTINIDTGCVFGGRLTALRYPEKELISVPARQAYAASRRPFLPVEDETGLSAQQQVDEVLDLEDVLGQRTLSTRLRQSIMIREENAVAALEVMSRFAANPKWLIYLPPTMSPSETADPERHPGLLEHPEPAFAHYRRQGIDRVVCEEKHMGSRAVVIVCRDEEAARRRFGVQEGAIGICYTRTGRSFFAETPTGQETEREMLALLQGALERSGFWERLGTDWVCLDAELMPWSAKAQELIRHQYAAVSAAARGALPEAVRSPGGRGAARCGGDGRPPRPLPGESRSGRSLHRGLAALLLAGDLDGGPAPRAVPHPGDRGGGSCGQGPPLAHGDPGQGLPCRAGPPDRHPAPGRGPGRSAERGRGDPLVGGDDRGGRRGDGDQASRVHRPGGARLCPAGPQVPRPGVPADHLRSGIHPAGEPGAPACAGSVGQALSGPAGIRPRDRSPRALRPPRAAAAGPRMRLRRAGAGERAGRPATVALPLSSPSAPAPGASGRRPPGHCRTEP